MENESNSFRKITYDAWITAEKKPLQQFQFQVCIFGMDFHAKFIQVVIDPNMANYKVTEAERKVRAARASTFGCLAIRVNVKLIKFQLKKSTESSLWIFETTKRVTLSSFASWVCHLIMKCILRSTSVRCTVHAKWNVSRAARAISFNWRKRWSTINAQYEYGYRFAEECHTELVHACCVTNSMEIDIISLCANSALTIVIKFTNQHLPIW